MNINLRNSGEWLILKGMIDARIETMRDNLERGGDDRERGGIAALRDIIQTVEHDGPQVEPTTYFPAGHKPT